MKPTMNTFFKRVIFSSLLFSSLLFSLTLSAKNVTVKNAEKVALNVFSERSGLAKQSIEIKEILPVETEGLVVYRIFNLNPTGYIIITADDNAEPLIGYGLDNNFSFDDAPPALLFLLEEYKEEMKVILKDKLEANDSITAKWKNYSDENFVPLKSYTPSTYLLETTWGQQNGYNNACPLDPNTGNRCVAGCSAVALAQILYYWNCRVFPDGTKTYTPPNFTTPLTVNFYDQDYDWDAMSINSADDDNAELIYHCGVAIGVSYTDSATGGTTSNANYAMEHYFGFDTDGLKWKDNFNLSTWINMLKNDIDNERPIYYRGQDSQGDYAHAWVIDGYKTTNEFHCNWGWYGQYINNWYPLTALNPGYDFNSLQGAIIGAEPILDACEGLNGASSVCPNSNEEYSVSVPALASVTWSKSNNNLTQVGGNTGSTYTVATSFTGGTCTITATIKNSQGQTFMQRSKSVNGLGWPTGTWTQNGTSHTLNTVNFVQSGSQVSTTVYYTPASSFSWSLQSGTGINSWSQYCSSVAANLYLTLNSSGNATFVLNTNTSSCGTINTTYTFAVGYMFSFVIAPNPASTEITVMRLDEQQAKGKAVLKPRKEKFKEKGFSPVDLSQEEYTVSLYSEKKGLLKTVKTSDENCKLDLRDLPPGTYFLHIENEYVLCQEQIIIEK
ncbi:MAG: C10 family peptidase [Bacteroidales bacterium]|nr:C10 family peptidase [Bacteroidales bacterium]